MAKRPWVEEDDPPRLGMSSPAAAATTSRRRGHATSHGSLQAQLTSGETLSGTTYPPLTPSTTVPKGEKQPQSLSSVEISRKVKACAACRKQKIRCHMEDGKPPCTRCQQRNLTCVLNKSLQMLMEERSQWHQDVVKDLELLHGGLQEVREQVSLSPLPQLRSSITRPDPDTMDPVDEKDSDMNSPMMAILDRESITEASGGRAESPAVPYSYSTMQPQSSRPSLYSIDSPEHIRNPYLTTGSSRDFIAAGLISVTDAQRLFDLYINLLDEFVDGLGGQWRTLDALRSRSPILTASIMTVAALHDPRSENIYPICNQELRRLVSASLFDQRVSKDYLRALCLASYWLSDVSWNLSGLAISKATEVNLSGNYQQVLAEGSEDAADCLRLWYHLFNCDRNLSFVYSRQSLTRNDASVMGWDEFLKSPLARNQDKKLMMMLGMHLIVGPIRELFGPDNGIPIPVMYATQIAYYSQQLDQWLGMWSTILREAAAENPVSGVGEIRMKSALMQYNFAKLYLCSHVFRGLSNNAQIPMPLREAAMSASAAAIDAVQLFLTDPDIIVALRGLPTYTHSMTCFACVFLLKIAVKRQDGLVEVDFVSNLAARLVGQFRSIPVAKWHPAGLLANMLERSAALHLGRRGSGVDSAGGSAAGVGEAMEGRTQTAFGLYPAADMTAVYQSVLETGEGSGIGGPSASLESPDLVFGGPNFFDFGAP